jgi:hypothetical protein
VEKKRNKNNKNKGEIFARVRNGKNERAKRRRKENCWMGKKNTRQK